jgi:hypothetical protein
MPGARRLPWKSTAVNNIPQPPKKIRSVLRGNQSFDD